ncbi:MAG: aspartate/glutamate racemase family protein [Candidatus Bipolaricaulaceae bacterium]
MRILVINPNSSVVMTGQIRKALQRIKRPDTELMVERVEQAPPAIESGRDVAQAVPGVLEWVQRAEGAGCQAAIIACFSDPGLDAAREVGNLLVLGIQETSLHLAAMLGHRFTILTPRPHRVPAKEREVRRIGLEGALASVRPLGLSVTETEAQPERTKARILEVAKVAVEEDGAEVLVLGCAGMVGYAAELERQLGVVVIDPTATTLKVCEGIVELGLRQSKLALYRTPT